jgi:outer membrane murein-binding lipoprotein Lpp
MTQRLALVALLASAAALAGCGRQAQLDRPGPLTGRPAAHPTPQRAAKDEAAARARADAAGRSDPEAPQSIDEVKHLGLDRPGPSDNGQIPVNGPGPPSQGSGDQ